MADQTPTPKDGSGPQTYSRSTASRVADPMPTPGPSTGPQIPAQDPWLKKHALTFDGGGVRGYYSLLFAKKLMEYIEQEEKQRGLMEIEGKHHRWEGNVHITSFYPCAEPSNVSHLDGNYKPFLPCHYFDYIAGTSTGGLIAIMLGRFRMTVDDCIHEYKSLSGKVFGKSRPLHALNSPFPFCKYNTKKFEEVIKDVIVRRVENGRDNPQNVRFDTEHGMCRVFVIANTADSNHSINDHRFFRSYEISTHLRPQPTQVSYFQGMRGQHSGRPRDVCVWHVARATTAAPLYFKPLELTTDADLMRATTNPQPRRRITTRSSIAAASRQQVERLEDGGFGRANNPSKEMLDEIRRQLPVHMKVGIFVSIGTARPRGQLTGIRQWRLIKRTIALLGDPEPIHTDMEETATKEPTFSYFRLNKSSHELHVEMDDWVPKGTGQETITRMTNAFNARAAEVDMVQKLQRCAKELVTARRARAHANPAKWNRFALGSNFECRHCSGEARRETDEDKFRVHLREEHNIIGEDEIEAELRRSESQWTYRAGQL
ncbi:FabD/lysophospholipase-like protein [Hypomontagnella monticulosa]|nr:FabD/lysophospholipase-like protein [Hypomontagnella monticulosa]